MYSQGNDNFIYGSNFGIRKNVTMIAVYITEKKSLQVMENVDNFIYDKSVQLRLHKTYLKLVSPQKHQEKQKLITEYELERSINEERLSYKRALDKVRDQEPKRKATRIQIDKVRDQEPERKAKRIQIDKIRDQEPERKATRNQIDKVRNERPQRKAKKDQIDKVRNKDPQRKAKQDQIDKVRDMHPRRKAMHKKIDKVRNKREDRKLMLSDYEQTETRRYYRNIRDKTSYQKKIIRTLATDTGFDVICSSCLQYKSKNYCKPVKKLTAEHFKKFIIKFCCLLKNRNDGQFVCNLCLKDIQKNITPKRSHINNFKFANFPRSFLLI